MQVKAKTASRDSSRIGTSGFIVLNSTKTKAMRRRTPRPSVTPMYGVVHKINGGWFTAKLTRIRPVTPVSVPIQSKLGRTCVFSLPRRSSLGSTMRARPMTMRATTAKIQKLQGHHQCWAISAEKTAPRVAPAGLQAPKHANPIIRCWPTGRVRPMSAMAFGISRAGPFWSQFEVF